MCTVSWKLNPEGYELFFNRDEQLTRSDARPPKIIKPREISFIAPRDGDAQGTWLAVNEMGVGAFLLNQYSSISRRGTQSRGNVALALGEAVNLADAKRIMESLRLREFSPFRAGIALPDTGIFTWLWNGTSLSFEGLQTDYLTSSSFQTESVVAARTNFFQAFNPSDIGDYLTMHTSHYPEKGPFSVCLHRDDAKTVSFSHITVRRHSIRFRYWPGSPCCSAVEQSVVLERKSMQRSFQVA